MTAGNGMHRRRGGGRLSGNDEAGLRNTDYSARLTTLLRDADQLLWSGQPSQAVALLNSALTWPLSDVERYTVGETMLRASNCRRGWDLYDLHPSRPVDRLRWVPRWDGGSCQMLIVVAEQGFGDAVQFLRFVPQVLDRAVAVVVALHDELFDVLAGSPILRGCEVVRKSVARARRWPTYARWERLMSIPAKIDNPHPALAEPYLQPLEPPSVTLPAAPPGTLTVGVAWRATPRRGFPNRSFPSRLATKFSVPGRTRVVTVHRTRDIRVLPDRVEEVGIGNFVDTLSVISQCDVVVTADTVTAHLAPALGVRTLICLLHRPDWRWGTSEKPTHWYAAADLLFQDGTRKWDTVMAAAAARILDIDPIDQPRSARFAGVRRRFE